MLINKALIKYGYSQFSLEILEYCKPKECLEREQYYIDFLKPEYNILKVAGSLLGFKHLEATKAIMKGRKVSAETRAKLSEANTGKTRSTETRQKISAAMKNENHPMYGKTLTDETREKLSIAKMREKNPMYGNSRASS
ncbi:hypothetical protein ABW19_dt0203323 [Dactylella cylindrospora]|nr:hypothetical protein ABW19_dt0203323 [Dactylella cylindrospora]